MSIVRVHKTANFTVMSNYHFKEKKMSLKAKGLLSLMLSLPDDWNYSVSGLVTLSKDGKDSVMSALAELEKFGYLSRERVTNSKGQFNGVEYNIYEQPQPAKPTAENAKEEKRNEGKANAENRTQLNTYLTNYLKDLLFTELSTKDMELLELYTQYIKVREEMDAPLNEIGLESLVTRAKRLSKGNVTIEKVLVENAIINGWKNVYPPRESELERLSADLQNTMRDMFGLE